MNDEQFWKKLIEEALIDKAKYNFLDFKLKLSENNNRLKEHINAFDSHFQITIDLYILKVEPCCK